MLRNEENEEIDTVVKTCTDNDKVYKHNIHIGDIRIRIAR